MKADKYTPIEELFPDRHPSVMGIVKWLNPNERLPQNQYAIAHAFASFTKLLLTRIENDSSEFTVGLRKILEAKDCMVRASLEKL